MGKSEALEAQGSRLQALVAAAKGPDPGAITELVALFDGRVQALAARYDAPGLEQEDLVQEARIGLLKAVRSYDAAKGVPFTAYATLCMKRRLATVISVALGDRQRPLQDYLPLSESEDLIAPGSGMLQDPEAQLILDEENLLQRRKIRSLLSGFEQKALNLYLAGDSYEAMAAKLHTSQKAVDNALQRVRRKLRAR